MQLHDMNKIILSLILFFSMGLTAPSEDTGENLSFSDLLERMDDAQLVYDRMHLEGLIQYDAFKAAYDGYKQLNDANNPILTVIDFSLPSTEERMYVLNLASKEVLFVTHVAHGRNSGGNYATSFSNRHGSYQSSLGFYRTAHTYNGGNGYSLVLDGLEQGINDNARPRAVVIHGADYCDENFIQATGRLGRSFGCPALPRELNRPIIDTIKEGSVLFIYADQPEYFAQSKVLHSSGQLET